jgi:hypothetical protein
MQQQATCSLWLILNRDSKKNKKFTDFFMPSIHTILPPRTTPFTRGSERYSAPSPAPGTAKYLLSSRQHIFIPDTQDLLSIG